MRVCAGQMHPERVFFAVVLPQAMISAGVSHAQNNTNKPRSHSHFPGRHPSRKYYLSSRSSSADFRISASGRQRPLMSLSRAWPLSGMQTFMLQVPTLVPKPGSPTVTQEHLPGHEIAAIRVLGLPWVMLDSECRSLKIRVSVVQPRRAAQTDAHSAPAGRAKGVHSAPGHHFKSAYSGHMV